jgi:hypothetical protein
LLARHAPSFSNQLGNTRECLSYYVRVWHTPCAASRIIDAICRFSLKLKSAPIPLFNRLNAGRMPLPTAQGGDPASHERHDTPLGLGISCDVALSRRQARVPGELLDPASTIFLAALVMKVRRPLWLDAPTNPSAS